MSNKICRYLLLLLPFFALTATEEASASHLMGADLSYKHIGGDTFLITLKVYRDCNGTGFASGTSITASASGCTSRSLALTKISTTDITPLCSGVQSKCATTTGSPYGVQEIVNTAMLRTSQFANCCTITLSWGASARNSTISTGMANEDFYTFATLDKCKAPMNNSPQISNKPIAIMCTGADFAFNNGVFDTLDGDSLGYSLVPALKGPGSNCTYSGSWSYLKPLTFLGFPNNTAALPSGFHLDSTTGDLAFRPTLSQTAVIVIQISEWRRINGTYQKIGESRRDMQVIMTSTNCTNNNPPVLPAISTKTVCVGDSAIFTITPTDGDNADTVALSWNKGIPGATFTTNNGTVKYATGKFIWIPKDEDSSSNLYYFTVTAKDNHCPLNSTSSKSYAVKVNSRPIPRIHTSNTCYPDTNTFADSSIIAYGFASYRMWNFGDGDTSSLISKKKHYADYGTYNVKLKIISNAGCADSTSRVVTYSPKPVAGFSYNKACSTAQYSFNNSSTINPDSISRVQWKFGDGDTSAALSPLKTYASSGVYNVRLIVTSTNGCKDSIQKVIDEELHLNPIPDTTICLGQSVSLTAGASGGDSGTYLYSWDQGAGDGKTITVSPVTTTTYRLILKDGCHNTPDTLWTVVTVRPPLDIIPRSDTTICLGQNVKLFATPTGGKASKYILNWDNGMGSGNNFTISPSATTIYRVILTDSCSSKADTSYATVSVRPALDLSVRSDTTICKGQNVKLFASLSGGYAPNYTYTWNNGIGTGNYIMIAPSVTTTYMVIGKDNCSPPDTMFVTITVRAGLDVVPRTDTTICIGQGVVLFATTTGGNTSAHTLSWDNFVGNGNYKTVYPYLTTKYRVILTDNCTLVPDTGYVNVTVRPVLDVTARTDTTICQGQSVRIYATTAGGFTPGHLTGWDNGLGAGNSFTVSPQTSTRFTVLLIDNCTSVPDTASVLIVVRPLPEITPRTDTTICKGQGVRLSATSSGGNVPNHTYTWDNGAGTGNNIMVYPAATTIYRVILTDNCSSTPDTSYVIITVRPELQITARTDTTICKGQSVMLSATSAGGYAPDHIFSWDNGLGSGNNFSVTPAVTTTYEVILTDNCSLKPDTATVTITVRPALDLTNRSDTTICKGQSVTLWASATGGYAPSHLFSWNNGIGTGSSLQVTPATSTTYRVILTDNCSSIPDTGYVLVTVRLPLDVAPRNDTTICAGQTVKLFVTVGGGYPAGYVLTWSNGLGTGNNIFVSPLVTTIYQVVLTDNCTLNPDTANIKIIARPPLEVVIRPDTTICVGQVVTLSTITSGGDTSEHTLSWDGFLGPNSTVTPKVTTTYRVILDDKCTIKPDTDYVTIFVRPVLDVTPRTDTTICRGQSVKLHASFSGGYPPGHVLNWNNGAGSGNYVSVSPAATTIYRVLLTDNCTVKPDTGFVTITVRPALDVIPRSDTTICAGQSLKLFAAYSGGYSPNHALSWDNGLGAGNNFTISPSATTTYSVILTDNCTSKPDTGFVTVSVRPALNIIAMPDTSICIGQSIILGASTTGGFAPNYLLTWDSGLGTGTSKLVSPGSTSTYRVILSDNCTSIQDTDYVTITVRPPLQITVRPDTTICIGQSVLLWSSGNGGDTDNHLLTWDNGLSTGVTHSVSPAVTTTYKVVLTDNCTTLPDSGEVTVFVRAALDITARQDTFFCNGQGAQLYASARGGDSLSYAYTWDQGVGPGNFIMISPAVTTTYQVIVGDNCTTKSDTAYVTLNVRTLLDLIVPRDTTICIGQPVSLYVGGTGGDSLYYTYEWNQGLGLGNNKSVTPDISTSYRVILTDNCSSKSDTDFVDLIVRPPLKVAAREDTLICQGQSVILNAQANGGDSTGYALTWDQGVGNGNNILVSPAVTTTYMVVLIDNCTVKNDTGYVTINVRAPLSITARTDTTICIGQNVNIFADAVGGYAPAYLLNWDQSLGSGNNISASPSVTTTYVVVLSDNCSSIQDTDEVTITVRPPLDLTPRSDSTICKGQSIILYAATTGGYAPAHTYTWDNGAGTGNFLTVSPASTTTYSVVVTDNCTQISDTGYVTVTVRAPLTISTLSDTTICLGQSITISGNAGGGNPLSYLYSWDNGLGQGISKTIAPTVTTTYRIILSDNCTSLNDTDLVTITVRPGLNITVRTDTTICIGQTVDLFGIATGGKVTDHIYNWSQAPSWNPTYTGNWHQVSPTVTTTWRLVLTDNCSTTPATAFVTITVRPPLQLIARQDTIICIGQSVDLYASSAGGHVPGHQIFWDNGLGSGYIKNVSPVVTTTYKVMLLDNCTVKSETAFVTITVRDPIGLSATKDTTICIGQNVKLNAFGTGGHGPGYLYSWDVSVSGGPWTNLGNGSQKTVAPVQSSIYRIILTDNCTAVNDTAFINVFVRPPLDVDAGADQLICFGQSAALSTSGIGGNTASYTYTWNNGAGTGPQKIVSPKITTTYRVVLSDNCTNKRDTDFVTVQVRAELKVRARPPIKVCAGTSVLLYSTGYGGDVSNYQFTWDNGLGAGNSFMVSPAQTTTYTVTLDDGCSIISTDTVTVEVEQLPVAAFNVSNPTVCYPEKLSFNNVSQYLPNSAFTWYFGDGRTSTETEPVHGYMAAGTYSVSLKITSNFGCIDSIHKPAYITVNPKPKADFKADPDFALILKPLIKFTNFSAGASEYFWDFADNSPLSTDMHTEHLYGDTGSYWVTLVAGNQFGCTDTISRKVHIHDVFRFYIPNTFTPNGDLLNDEFVPAGMGIVNYSTKIFNRWGALVFESSDKNEHWNGGFNNRLPAVQDGVYSYQITVQDFEGKPHFFSGVVHLLK